MSFTIMPNEIVERLLEYSGAKEWVAMGGTSRRYREVSSEDRLWKRDYDQMKHVIGYPEAEEDYREAAFKPLVTLGPEEINNLRKSLRPQNNYIPGPFGGPPHGTKGGLVVVGERRIVGSVNQYSGSFDIFTPGLSQDPGHVFSRLPVMVTRRVNEAFGIISSIRLWEAKRYQQDLENLEAGWRDRGGDVPVMVFTPSKPRKAEHKGLSAATLRRGPFAEDESLPDDRDCQKVSQRQLAQDLLQFLPAGGFRIKACDISNDKGMVEGMEWLGKEASKQKQRVVDIVQQPDFRAAMAHHFVPPPQQQPQPPQFHRVDSFGSERSMSFDLDGPVSPLAPMNLSFGSQQMPTFGPPPQQQQYPQQQAPQKQQVPKAPKLNVHPAQRVPFQRQQMLQQQQQQMQQMPQQAPIQIQQQMPQQQMQQMPHQMPQPQMQMQQMPQQMPQMQQMPQQQMQQMPHQMH